MHLVNSIKWCIFFGSIGLPDTIDILFPTKQAYLVHLLYKLAICHLYDVRDHTTKGFLKIKLYPKHSQQHDQVYPTSNNKTSELALASVSSAALLAAISETLLGIRLEYPTQG